MLSLFFCFVAVMEMIGVTLVTLTLACTACGTHTSVSGRNQYEANEDGPDAHAAVAAINAATNIQLLDDNNLNKIDIPPHRFNLLINKLSPKESSSSSSSSMSTVPELQIGCEEGLIKTRKKRASYDNFIAGGSYNQWTNSLLRPPMYQINRPYIIPIWGAPGRIPIYFPPQPIPYNPGYPHLNPPRVDDPLRPNNGYLPPQRTTEKPEKTTVTLVNKFGDDPPIWDDGEAQPATPRPSGGRPTRRPRPDRPTSTHPPLVHIINNKSGGPNNLSPTFAPPLALTTTYRSFAQEGTRPLFTSRPQVRPQTPSPPPPQTVAQRQPSDCVWAIIQCCSGRTTSYSSRCFEERNCAGAFWDSSPCESDFAKAAVAVASQYYQGAGR